MSSLHRRIETLEVQLGAYAAAQQRLAEWLPGMMRSFPAIPEEEIRAIWHREVGNRPFVIETWCCLNEELKRTATQYELEPEPTNAPAVSHTDAELE